MPGSDWRGAAGFDAFPSFVLLKQLCVQAPPVEEVHAGSLAIVRSFARERLEHLFHSSRYAETAHSTFEYQRSLPEDGQSCPEVPIDDPCHKDNSHAAKRIETATTWRIRSELAWIIQCAVKRR